MGMAGGSPTLRSSREGWRLSATTSTALVSSSAWYVTPGIPKLAVTQNTPIEGTTYHASDIAITSRTEVTYLGGTMYYIDYAAPGSQEFVDSWANLFASWGIDYLKLDGVGDWNVPDIQAWSRALSQTGRPIHLQLANNLNPSYWPIWGRYSNGWRISTDIEAYNGHTLTSWDQVALRFAVLPNWLRAGVSGGWNDLDSLIVGGANSGLTPDERQTMVTLWALAASPLITGDDLRNLDAWGIGLLTNPEVVGVDQSGVVAAPLNTGTQQQVWTALQPDGSYAVGLFNLGDAAATVGVSWSSLGFIGPATVRDLWARADVGSFTHAFSVQLNSHASVMLRVTPAAPVQQWLAPAARLSQWAVLGSSRVSPKGQRAQYVGYGSAITFANINVTNGGTYHLTTNYVNGDAAARTAILTVNGNSSQITFPNVGNWDSDLTNQGVTTTVVLAAGNNTIAFSNPGGWAPDFVGITIQPHSPAGPTYFKLLSVLSAQVIDTLFASTAAGAPIIQWPDHSGPNQQWQMTASADGGYHLINRRSGHALAASGFAAAGRQLGQWPVQRRLESDLARGRRRQWDVRTRQRAERPPDACDIHLARRQSGAAVVDRSSESTVGHRARNVMLP